MITIQLIVRLAVRLFFDSSLLDGLLDDESDESKPNPTNPLQRALNAFKEAPTSPRSSSSSMVMSPVTPPTEDEVRAYHLNSIAISNLGKWKLKN